MAKRPQAPTADPLPASGIPTASAARVPRRVVVESIDPEVNGGRFPIKRTVGEPVVVEADIYADGHDVVAAAVLWRMQGQRNWHEVPMRALGNDRWIGRFEVDELGTYEYTVEGWIDWFATWRQDLAKKAAAEQDVSSELLEGAALLRAASDRVLDLHDRDALLDAASVFERASVSQVERVTAALSPELTLRLGAAADRSDATRYEPVLPVLVERERARFGAWYEMFPRSAGSDPTRSATFDEAAARLPYVASMGFDVLYLPPIHPIGRSFRKGPNNAVDSRPEHPGSPWAIGSAEGGHTAIEPGLGTLTDFDRFVEAARRHASRDRPRHRVSGIAGSSLRQATSGVVPSPARRHDQVRREPAEEVSGHLPVRLRVGRLARRCGAS